MTLPAAQTLTLATKITLTRVLMIPVFVIAIAYSREGIGLMVFLMASLADAVDGHLARRRGEKTPLGAMLDPIADKLLMFSAYVLMGTVGLIPAWLAIVVISRDVLITLGCLLLFMTVGFITPSPSFLGKATTAIQMGTVAAALLSAAAGGGEGSLLLALYGVAGALTIASGVHYLFFVGGRFIHQKGKQV